jgi:hypothetical protein
VKSIKKMGWVPAAQLEAFTANHQGIAAAKRATPG